jgi:[calcium/calmodulin-dependent protein kinase] kinase
LPEPGSKLDEESKERYRIKEIPDIKEKDEATKIEAISRVMFMQLAEALVYLHDEHNMIHRDLKLENILFATKSHCLKVTDFTVAREVAPGAKAFDCEGTPAFTAPECHVPGPDGYFPKPTDIWSLGTCLFTYVTQEIPFNKDSEIEIQIMSKNEEPTYPDHLSPELKDLI